MTHLAQVFKTITYYKESSGICRWDFFDWGRKIRSVMRRARPHAVVIMMGTNDTQAVWRDGEWIAYGDTAWRRAYEERVADMIDTMLDGGVRRVYWVGMPVMGESWRNSRMKLVNMVFERQAGLHPGVEYVDVWPLFTSGSGSYLPQWRGPDGVHFTVAGQERLAKTVLAALKKDWAPHGLSSTSPTPADSPSPSASAVESQ